MVARHVDLTRLQCASFFEGCLGFLAMVSDASPKCGAIFTVADGRRSDTLTISSRRRPRGSVERVGNRLRCAEFGIGVKIGSFQDGCGAVGDLPSLPMPAPRSILVKAFARSLGARQNACSNRGATGRTGDFRHRVRYSAENP